ncbi:MAG: HEAT repeat domain-containing protein [Candidatus Thorarchaeota archaeon]
MGTMDIEEIIRFRDYVLLESAAEEYISQGQWSELLETVSLTRPIGKGRDALVHLLNLESVGGTDSDIFEEFSTLSGSNLFEIRAEAISKTMSLLRSQIANRNTFFIDAEMMTASPFVLLYEDVMSSRLKELDELCKHPTRNDLLKTFYGFTLLTTSENGTASDTQSPYRRYWRRRNYTSRPRLGQETVQAINEIMKDLSSEIQLNDTYETLGSSYFLREKCSHLTSSILANIIRLCLYMTPWDRGRAASDLGRLGDSRPLEYLHNRIEIEPDLKTRAAIARSIGAIGNPNSFDILKKQVSITGRSTNALAVAATEGIGGIYSDEATEFLKNLLQKSQYLIVEAAIGGLQQRSLKAFPKMLQSLLKSSSIIIVRKVVGALLEDDKDGHRILVDSAPIVIKKLYKNRASRYILNRFLSLKEIQESEEIHKFLATKIRGIHDDRMKIYRSKQSNWWTGRRLRRYNNQLQEMVNLVLNNIQSPLPWELDKVIREIMSHTQMELRIPIRMR